VGVEDDVVEEVDESDDGFGADPSAVSEPSVVAEEAVVSLSELCSPSVSSFFIIVVFICQELLTNGIATVISKAGVPAVSSPSEDRVINVCA
jgi:hypothetical protein